MLRLATPPNSSHTTQPDFQSHATISTVAISITTAAIITIITTTPYHPPLYHRSSIQASMSISSGEAGDQNTSSDKTTKTWFNVLVEQLEAPLGPAVTLASLVSTNVDIQEDCVTPELVMNRAEIAHPQIHQSPTSSSL